MDEEQESPLDSHEQDSEDARVDDEIDEERYARSSSGGSGTF